jgi:NAD(P)-dependent dehydrogenase (short-subunit alcohol dehydrogenase family)
MGQSSSTQGSPNTDTHIDISSYLKALRPNLEMTSTDIWLITGATSGIGLALTRAALAAGHKVIAGCRDKSRDPALTAELEQLGATWLELDVSIDVAEERVRDAVAEFGHVDVLINNAGYGVLGAIEDITSVTFLLAERRLLLIPQSFAGHVRGHVLILCVTESSRSKTSSTSTF